MLTEKDFIIDRSKPIKVENGKISWKSPSNIALIKYWGKSEPQIPKNPSISFTLNDCHTTTTVGFRRAAKSAPKASEIKFDIIFEGKSKEDFKPKIRTFFERIHKYVPFLSTFEFVIESSNSFPHSSGIASSASGMSALALCIMSLEKRIYPDMNEDYFYKKASYLARLGSGSACRSIRGPVVEWGNHNELVDSSDLYGIVFPYKLHQNFKNFQDTILLVDEGEKEVSSTLGHQLMEDHPFAENRFSQANKHLSNLVEILQNGDLNAFVSIVEKEALSLHAMMMTSDPYFVLIKPNTLKIINLIWEYRKQHNSTLCFTLDAGANVHILYPEKEKEAVLKFIRSSLVQYCQENNYICDAIGNGAISNVIL